MGSAVTEMKSGKVPGLDGFPLECLEKGGMSTMEWLVRLLKVSFDMGLYLICEFEGHKNTGFRCSARSLHCRFL